MHKANVETHHDPRRQPDNTKAIIDMAWMKRPRITDRCDAPHSVPASDDPDALCSMTMRPCVRVDIRPTDCL
ncbi:hypothetical protein N7530_003912 [Penicillium desertorum]|uniref:Uncharacterized protein n=1 Tax=Penicillium desertorum TaxID=1303715 RepID=A0A9X0BQ09_9EURO|nr:hypothetical protein N7530_003912 [Penicillium desertorum]